jgi:hypothetical protein
LHHTIKLWEAPLPFWKIICFDDAVYNLLIFDKKGTSALKYLQDNHFELIGFHKEKKKASMPPTFVIPAAFLPPGYVDPVYWLDTPYWLKPPPPPPSPPPPSPLPRRIVRLLPKDNPLRYTLFHGQGGIAYDPSNGSPLKVLGKKKRANPDAIAARKMSRNALEDEYVIAKR